MAGLFPVSLSAMAKATVGLQGDVDVAMESRQWKRRRLTVRSAGMVRHRGCDGGLEVLILNHDTVESQGTSEPDKSGVCGCCNLQFFLGGEADMLERGAPCSCA